MKWASPPSALGAKYLRPRFLRAPVQPPLTTRSTLALLSRPAPMYLRESPLSRTWPREPETSYHAGSIRKATDAIGQAILLAT
jgi:hypothetical protein